MAGVVTRLLSVLESVISKLARYDEGSILGSILSFTVNVSFRNIFYLIFFSSYLFDWVPLFFFLPLFHSPFSKRSVYTMEAWFSSLLFLGSSSFKIISLIKSNLSKMVNFSSSLNLYSTWTFNNTYCISLCIAVNYGMTLNFLTISFLSISLWFHCPLSFSNFPARLFPVFPFLVVCMSLCACVACCLLFGISFNRWQYKQNVSGSGRDLGQAYVNFTRNSMDQIRSKVNDELWILNLFDVRINFFFCFLLLCDTAMRLATNSAIFHSKFKRPRVNPPCYSFQAWYAAQIQMLGTWLADRMNHSLHPYQCTCLAHIVKVLQNQSQISSWVYSFTFYRQLLLWLRFSFLHCWQDLNFKFDFCMRYFRFFLRMCFSLLWTHPRLVLWA